MNRFFVCFVLFCFGFGRLETADGIAGIVEDEIILKSDVLQQVFYLANSQNINIYNNEAELERLYGSVLDQMVDGLVLFNLAQQDTTIIVDEFLIEEKLQEEISRQVGLVGSVSSLEEAYGEPLSRIRAKLRKELKKTFVIEQFRGGLYPLSIPSPKDVQSFFVEFQDSLPPLPESISFSVLEWPILFDTKKEEDLIGLLNNIRDSVLSIESFAVLAETHSDDSGSKKNGGSLGYTTRGTLFSEYEEVAYNLEVGQTSKPFKSPIGYHLVFLENRLGEKIKTSHILKKISLDQKDIDNSVSSFNSFLGGLGVDKSVNTFDSLCVHHKVSLASFQGVFNRVPKTEVPEFLANVELGVDGFSNIITNKDKLYLVRFFDKQGSTSMTLENSYTNLYEMTQNKLLFDQLQELINKHASTLYIKKFY